MGDDLLSDENLRFARTVFDFTAEKDLSAHDIANKINALKFMDPVTTADVEEFWERYGGRKKFRRRFRNELKSRKKANAGS